MAMAVGPDSVVQLVNGGYEAFSKSGFSLTGPQTDTGFWIAAGISPDLFTSDPDNLRFFQVLSDPRAVFDPGSGRFFVSQLQVGSNLVLPDFIPVFDNHLLLAVSKTSNPLDGWTAVSSTSFSNIPDYPTLGVDRNALYLGTNDFDGLFFIADPDSAAGARSASLVPAPSNSILSIPKADLLGDAPSLARLSLFSDLPSDTYGAVPQPAIDPGGAHGAVLASVAGSDQAAVTTVTGSGGASPSLSAPTVLAGSAASAFVTPLQPGSVEVVDFDNRFTAPPVAVGNLLYSARSVGDPGSTFDYVQWMIVDLTSKLVLQQGAIGDPNFFDIFPSIAANANGDFVIGFDRSGAANDPSNYISAYAVSCHYDGSAAGCGSPLLLQQGLALTQDGTEFGRRRWGDYSATAIDPTDQNAFWTALEVPLADGSWGTQITEVQLTPEPATLGLLGLGFACLIGLSRRRRKAATRRRPAAILRVCGGPRAD